MAERRLFNLMADIGDKLLSRNTRLDEIKVGQITIKASFLFLTNRILIATGRQLSTDLAEFANPQITQIADQYVDTMMEFSKEVLSGGRAADEKDWVQLEELNRQFKNAWSKFFTKDLVAKIKSAGPSYSN